jgi:shikimate kinase
MKMCLIGFQGAGKTTVGRKIASILSLDFFDLDDNVVARHAASSIKEVFERLGEARFREEETVCLASIVARPSYVVALGGGAVEALASVSDDIHVVYLFRSLEMLESELRFPYPCWVDAKDPLSSLHKRWEERHPLYFQRATAVVIVEKRSVEEDADKVLRTLHSGSNTIYQI